MPSEFIRPALIASLLFIVHTVSAIFPVSAMVLVRDGRPACTLVLGSAAGPAERQAAEELTAVIHQISGARVVIEQPSSPPEAGGHIFFGAGSWLLSPRFRECAEELNVVGEHGFVLHTVGGAEDESLVVAGGGPPATTEAAHALLRALGVRWYAPGVTRTPRRRSINLPSDDLSDFPCFVYRDIAPARPGISREWKKRLRLNAGTGGYVPMEVPVRELLPDSLFQKHPEYLPLIRGNRTGEFGFPCFSRTESAAAASNAILERLAREPGITHVLLAFDYPGLSCHCPDCERMTKREGQSGPPLVWMNRVAEKIAARHPGVFLVLSDPWTTGPPPSTVRPRNNVTIRLRARSFGSGSGSGKDFEEAVRRWSEVSERVHIVLPFVPENGAPLPFHGLDDQAGNLLRHRTGYVEGVFFESPPEGVYIADAEFRTWALSELMWNADCSTDELAREWAKGVFGNGYGPMLELREHIRRLPGTAEAPVADEQWLSDAERMLQRAYALSLSNTPGNRLVATARLGLWRLRLESAYAAARKGTVPSASDRTRYREILDRLGSELRERGFERVSAGETVEDFIHRIEIILGPAGRSRNGGGR